VEAEPKPYRRRLPDERRALTHKFQVAGHEGYITVGLYPDGQPGEIFLKMAKEGSTISGLMDTLATMTSLSLQYGVPLRDLVNKFAHMRFEPAGFTGNSEIPIAKSIVDYIFRWMGSRFLDKDDRDGLGIISRDEVDAKYGALPESWGGSTAAVASAAPALPIASDLAEEGHTSIGEAGGPKASAMIAEPPPASAVGGTDLPVLSNGHASANGHTPASAELAPIKPLASSGGVELGGGPKVAFSVSADSPSCADCGSIMVRNGSCYKCLNCGSTSGCS
jgi:ribonucleoside-diphosphate reductase alpha chain